MPSKHKIYGIFSTQEEIKIGTGTTQQKKINKIWWQAREIENNRVEIQVLDSNYEPHGPKKIISKDTFLATFEPDPEIGSKLSTSITTYIKNNFDLAFIYLQKGDAKKAIYILESVLTTNIKLKKKHKHTFNECAIDLRKHRLYNEAIKYYKQALKLSPKDEHIYFNIAKAYYCLHNFEDCQRYLQAALKINPNFVEAKKFLNFIEKEIAEREEMLDIDF